MKTLSKAFSSFVGLLILIGVVQGVVRWNRDSNGGAADLIKMVVSSIADWTYRLIPTLIDLIQSIAQ